MTHESAQPRAPQGTRLHAVIQRYYQAWLLYRNEAGRAVPELVRREFERFLRCGDPGFGYAVLGCLRCGVTRAIARSCKGRAWCPYCLTRRQRKLAGHVVDGVFGDLPVRHWVLCLPPHFRFTLGYNPAMLTAALAAFVDSIFHYIRWKAKHELDLTSVELACPGAVSVIHRCSADLDTNIHFHVLVPEGVFIRLITDGPVTFHSLGAPTDEEIEAVALDACRRTCAAAQRRGHWQPDARGSSDTTVAGVLTFGDRRGQPAKFFGQVARYGEGGLEPRDGAYAFHVSADHIVEAGNRRGLRDLVEYVLAPPLSDGQVSWGASGKVVIRLKRARRDGSDEAEMAPVVLLDRLAALVGRRRSKGVRYHGVYASNAAIRSEVMPWRPLEQPSPAGEAPDATQAYRMLHAQHHVVDEPACPHCRRRFTLVKVVTPTHTYRNPGWNPPDGWPIPRDQDSRGRDLRPVTQSREREISRL